MAMARWESVHGTTCWSFRYVSLWNAFVHEIKGMRVCVDDMFYTCVLLGGREKGKGEGIERGLGWG